MVWLPLFGAAMLNAGPTVANAASMTINAYGGNGCPLNQQTLMWSPANVTINVGDQVTWGQGCGSHGLDKLGSWPSGCPSSSFGSCSFPAAGVYNFQCSVHGAAMPGSVTVQGANPPPPPPTSSSGSGGGGSGSGGSGGTPTRPKTNASPSAAASAGPTSAGVALASPSPSPSASPAGGPTAVPNSPVNSSSGPPLVPLVAAALIVLAAGAGAFWYLRIRPGGAGG
jgi:plastocyanin